jgi:hypothetical protein
MVNALCAETLTVVDDGTLNCAAAVPLTLQLMVQLPLLEVLGAV